MNSYFYIDENGKQIGPVEADRLVKIIKPSTLVWAAGMNDWTPAELVDELSQMMAEVPPVVTPPEFKEEPKTGVPYGNNMGGSAQQYQPNSNYDPRTSRGTGKFAVKPNNWLVWAILSTICCFLPLGVVAIIYAAKVDSAWERGDYEEAIDASSKAKLFTILTFILGVVGYSGVSLFGIL